MMSKFVWIGVIIVASSCLASNEPLKLEDEKSVEQPQLVLKEPKNKYPGPPADNSRCFVCHANYEEEKLAVIHLKANVGCVLCHGESDKHCSDEDNVTAPDKMYPHKGAVRFKCLSCHDWRALIESDKTKKDLKDPPDHQAVLLGLNKDGRFCMDCHGEHKLSWRTRRWDKRTGKLITRDGTPSMVMEKGTNSNSSMNLQRYNPFLTKIYRRQIHVFAKIIDSRFRENCTGYFQYARLLPFSASRKTSHASTSSTKSFSLQTYKGGFGRILYLHNPSQSRSEILP